MTTRPRVTDFFRFHTEYLSQPKSLLAFWGSLVSGVLSIVIAILVHGTRWERFEIATAAVGVFYLVDACLLRYLYEVKREARLIREWLTSIDEATEE